MATFWSAKPYLTWKKWVLKPLIKSWNANEVLETKAISNEKEVSLFVFAADEVWNHRNHGAETFEGHQQVMGPMAMFWLSNSLGKLATNSPE